MPEISLPLPVARAVLRPLFRVMLNARLPFTVQRRLMDAGAAGQLLPRGTRVERIRLGERPAERLTAGPVSDAITVLYLHGGGYTVGSPVTHRALAAVLAREIGCRVHVPDYRLAPEHPFPAALDDAEAAFLDLVATGYRPERIAVAGDSAGGGLSMALALRLRDRHGFTPAALGLIAPWTDPNEIPERSSDLVLTKPWSRACADAYLGDGDGLDPGYAPLLAELHGLPPTYVQADVDELLHGQCLRLVTKLESSGVTVDFSESRGLWHVSQAQATLVEAAAQVTRELAVFLRQALRPAQTRSIG
ncbi:Monoterpene epsilon-lactone hydrolase [Nocardia otitidiscaviarum]|uniref:Alpha/beta hydrolase n=1 Tax=Nocardia otitidiscaviarum TaxID=1823 RepID=A0A378Y8A7_9NOCA|nr:alpha/beta hydrolase [Nocardia otitidiscaviarum]MBF6178105.1 alpha/beta hydrolase [Nocardia otitidiscaviarum]MCP9623282.1 alpha/beta hydrolase [Nocardia otitidiscaviarum]QDP77901.1 alpha/beta hydrolase [Nocardia otitidiscaviarum]SUA73078.1 Monoterpene epsilon-lactone hydrolase [Nocardia otitidiscaviarum]